MAVGHSMEDFITDVGTFIESGQRRNRVQRSDVETWATIMAVYPDWTADIVLGTPQGTGKKITGPELQKVPILTSLGNSGSGYGDQKLPQVGSTVRVRFMHNRSTVVIDPMTVYHSPTIQGQTNEEKNVTDNVKTYFDDVGDVGTVHPSGTKWKVKANGDVAVETTSGVKIDIVGDKVTLTGASAIELGSTVKKLVNDTFQTLYNNHTHGAGLYVSPSGNVTGTSGAPVAAMGSGHLTSKVKGE